MTGAGGDELEAGAGGGCPVAIGAGGSTIEAEVNRSEGGAGGRWIRIDGGGPTKTKAGSSSSVGT